MTTLNNEVSGEDLTVAALTSENHRLRQQVTQLGARIAVLTTENTALRARIASLTKDLGIVGTRLREEAVNRQWCAEYGEFVHRVNDETDGEWLMACEVSRVAVFRITVAYTTSDGYTKADSLRDHVGDFDGYDDAQIDDVDVVLVQDDLSD